MNRRSPGRKLLVASLGVATVSYVACSRPPERTGNLVAPPEPPRMEDAGTTAVPEAAATPTATVVEPVGPPPDMEEPIGNVAPPPLGDAGDAERR